MASGEQDFVFGVDLDGVCADFYGKIREIAAVWTGKNLSELPREVTYGFAEWGLVDGEYERLHRFAITQTHLFETVEPMNGAPQSLRRLSAEGVRIRIITHRLFIAHFHQPAIDQTVRWLEAHAIPYWDLCFMADKGAVGADLYIEDTPRNIEALRAAKKPVIVFDNSTNRDIPKGFGGRATNWNQAENMARRRYYTWLRKQGRELPPAPGLPPRDLQAHQ